MNIDEGIRTVAFWQWFKTHRQEIEAAYDSADSEWLDFHLGGRLAKIQPRLRWEIGPYHDPDRTLVVSPGVRENIPLAEAVVAAAPAVPGWHFLPVKPPKELTRLVMDLPGVEGAEVDADNWSYRLTSYNQMEFFDIEVFASNPVPIKDTDLELLTRRLIESMVGERLYLERFGYVTVHRLPATITPEELTAFPHLGRHMSQLLRHQ
jgi:hypothetical protein